MQARRLTDLRLFLCLQHTFEFLAPCRILQDELLLEQVLPHFDILRCHWQPALVRQVVAVEVRGPQTQPFDVGRSETGRECERWSESGVLTYWAWAPRVVIRHVL